MRNVSKKYIETAENRRDFYATAEITFANGDKKPLGKEDFALSGNNYSESGESSSFPLGLLVAKRVKLALMNDDDRWSYFDFYGAKILLRTSFDLDDGTTETLNIGTFTVVTPESYGTTVIVSAMDDSYKTDIDYSTELTFPVSAGVALRDSCRTCGITLLTDTFANSDYEIPQKPQDLTHRQFIGMIAMLAGGNAVMDEYNRLKILSYDFSPFERFVGADGGIFDLYNQEKYVTGDALDGGSFVPWSAGGMADGGQFGDRDNVHVLHSFKSGMVTDVDDVVITGLQMESKDEDNNTVTHLFGETGYVLKLENQLAVGKEDVALALIGAKVVGLRFRPFSGDYIALPTAEFMDLAVVIDWKQNVYQTVLTDVTFNYFGFTALKCAADSPIRNSSKYYGNETKAIVQARYMVEKERTDRQKALDVLAQELAQSSGLYMTAERQDDGSTIYYMHDKPTLGESMIVWKMTAEAFAVSTDGGKSYPYGLDATGMAILDRIYAIGINADYITAGAFEIIKNGKTMVLMDKDTKQVILRPDIFELSDGSTIGSIAEGKANSALSSAKSYADTKASSTLSSAKSYADSAASDAVSDAMTQQNIFNKLTGGGSNQGIYLSGGKVYLNASYMNVTYLSTLSANLGTVTAGILQSENYSYISGNFANAGFYLNLKNGLLRSKQWGIDANGNAHFSGTLDACTVTGSTIQGSTLKTEQSGGYVELKDGYIYVYGRVDNKSEAKLEASIYGYAFQVSNSNGGARIDSKGTFSIRQLVKNSSITISDISNRIDITADNTYINGYLGVSSGMYVSGDKSKIASTSNYGNRLLYCYEMPAQMFGDIGEGTTDENGECYIYLDDIFSETVSAQIEYQVFLQKEGPGDIWIAEKTPQYFIVKGTENLKFAWEIKAKQKGYEYDRLEVYAREPELQEPNYENQYLEEIEELIKEQEAVLYEAA